MIVYCCLLQFKVLRDLEALKARFKAVRSYANWKKQTWKITGGGSPPKRPIDIKIDVTGPLELLHDMHSQVLTGMEGVDSDRRPQPMRNRQNTSFESDTEIFTPIMSSSPPLSSLVNLTAVNRPTQMHLGLASQLPSTSQLDTNANEPVDDIILIENTTDNAVELPVNETVTVQSEISAPKRPRRFFGTTVSRQHKRNNNIGNTSSPNSNSNSNSDDLRSQFIRQEMQRAEELHATKMKIIQSEHQSRERRNEECFEKRILLMDCAIRSLGNSPQNLQTARVITEAILEPNPQLEHELNDTTGYDESVEYLDPNFHSDLSPIEIDDIDHEDQ